MGADYQHFVQLVFQLPCRRRFNVVVAAYDLRHTWITDALTQGCDPMTVARIAGTSLSMITRTYGHLLHDHAEKAFASVELL